MNYDRETINQCIRNIFIITVQIPQSWSSLESHFQSEQDCLRGQVHGVSLAMAGCPSFHIAAFNHAVPSCRNLKLHGHKCRRAKISVRSKLCPLWQIMVQNHENLFEGSLWISARLNLALKVIAGVWSLALWSETATSMVTVNKAVVTLERSLYSVVWHLSPSKPTVLGPEGQIFSEFPGIDSYSYLINNVQICTTSAILY